MEMARRPDFGLDVASDTNSHFVPPLQLSRRHQTTHNHYPTGFERRLSRFIVINRTVNLGGLFYRQFRVNLRLVRSLRCIVTYRAQMLP